MLRKASWGDHANSSDKNFWRIHLGWYIVSYLAHILLTSTSDHCIEMLRQNIMCRGDVTMITYDWVEGVKDPFPNFNIPHRCRNFDNVLNWIDEHRVFMPKSKMVRLEDNVDLSTPP
jgi:hypothetical protein